MTLISESPLTNQADSSGRLSDYSDIAPLKAARGTFISLYAGAGGLDIGFALAGFVPTWVSELDGNAAATHDAALRFLSESRPHLKGRAHETHVGDLLDIPESDLPAPGAADLVIGGPPCQGFSVAGKMDPEDPRSKHVFHFLDVVERVRPKAFLLENVKALYANKRWQPIRSELESRASGMDYNVKTVLVNAADFGVPQSRERMLMFGVRKDIGTPVDLVKTSAHARPTVRDALAQLPLFGAPGNDSICTAKITLAKTPVLRRSPWAGMLFNGAGRPLDLDAPSMTLPASMGGNRTPIVDQAVLTSSNSHSWVRQYHSTLLGSGAREEVATVPDDLRRLTVQEAAAIQTFPIGMPWIGRQSARYRQIGNAVPPRLGLAAARAIWAAIGGSAEDGTDAN